VLEGCVGARLPHALPPPVLYVWSPRFVGPPWRCIFVYGGGRAARTDGTAECISSTSAPLLTLSLLHGSLRCIFCIMCTFPWSPNAFLLPSPSPFLAGSECGLQRLEKTATCPLCSQVLPKNGVRAVPVEADDAMIRSLASSSFGLGPDALVDILRHGLQFWAAQLRADSLHEAARCTCTMTLALLCLGLIGDGRIFLRLLTGSCFARLRFTNRVGRTSFLYRVSVQPLVEWMVHLRRGNQHGRWKNSCKK